MARRAGRRRRGGMHSRQRKPRCAVVECCCRPTHRRVASGAVRYGKCSCGSGVWRGVGVLPVRQMAARNPASGRGDIQGIVTIHVAQIAGHVGMPIGQRKPGRGVIKDSRRPRCYRVAGRARRCGCRESGRDVIRHRAANRRRANE